MEAKYTEIIKKYFEGRRLRFVIFYIITVAILYAYSLVSKGYYSEVILFENSILEFFILSIMYLISFIVLKKKAYMIPFVIILLYSVLDLASLIYNRNLDYTYLFHIPLLIESLVQSKGLLVYGVIFFIISLVLVLLYKYSFVKKILLAYTLIVLFFIILVTPSFLISPYFIIVFEKYAFEKKEFWSDDKIYYDYEKTGRISSFLYEGLIKSNNKLKIKHYKVKQSKDLETIVSSLKSKIQKRDVYIIGLESFFIPQRLANVKLNKEIPQIKNASTHRSPIYGGGTIQSEFEILCGVPALQKFSAFELTEFKGNPTNCLPTILAKLGYSTIFTNTFKPQPSFEATKSLGFSDVNFPREYFKNKKTYLSNDKISQGEYAIYDDDLYAQNNKYIRKEYRNKPVFNYMFSVWGHAFHEITSPKRPEIINVLNKKELNLSDHTQRAINQQYYRINSIKKYLKNINTISPNALVIFYSDHLPVLDNKDKYKLYGLKGGMFDNFLLIMDKGEIIKYDKVNLYAVMDIILDRLSSGWYCKNKPCKTKEIYADRYKHRDEYYSIMIPPMIKPGFSSLTPLKIKQKYYFDTTSMIFEGFSSSEEKHRWTNKFKSSISFKYIPKKNTNTVIVLDIGTLGKQNISISLNGKLMLKNKDLQGDKLVHLIPKNAYFNESNINTISFHLPNARQASDKDLRILAIKFKSLIIKETQ